MNREPVDLEHRMMELGIVPISPSGDDQPPKFKYPAPHYGQVNHIKTTCRNTGVRVDSYARDVQIFSKRKLPALIKAIELSHEQLRKPEAPLPHETMTYTMGQRVLCVLVKRDGIITMYVVEANLEDVMFQVYEKNIPKAQVMKIYDKKRTMVEALLEDERLVI